MPPEPESEKSNLQVKSSTFSRKALSLAAVKFVLDADKMR